MSIGIENETALRDSRLHPFFDLIQPTPNTILTKVVDNGPINISAKFEVSILKTFPKKSFLAHIDAVKSRNSHFLPLAPIEKL